MVVGLAAAVAAGLAVALWPTPEVVDRGATPSLAAEAEALPPEAALAPPRDIWELLAALQPSAASAGGAVRQLRGRVVDSSRAAVAGAVVELLPAANPAHLLGTPCGECGQPLRYCTGPDAALERARVVRASRETQPLATVRAGTDGRWSTAVPVSQPIIIRAHDAAGRKGDVHVGFGSLPKGWVLPDGGRSNEGGERMIVARGDPVGVELEVYDAAALDAAELEVLVEAPEQLAGVVQDEGGQPIAGARVQLVQSQDAAHVEVATGPDGSFVAPCPGVRCAAWVVAEAEGFAPQVRELASPGFDELVLKLARTTELELVTLIGSRPVEADLVVIVSRHTRRLRTPGGSAHLANLAVRELSVEASAGEYTSGKRTIRLDQARLKVELPLRRSARALLEVVGPDGRPSPRTSVTLKNPETELVGKTDARGSRLELGPVGEGAYKLFVRPAEGPPLERSVDLLPGDNPIRVTLAEGLALKGNVVEFDGAVPSPTRVSATSGELTVSGWSAHETGAFRLFVGSPGPWEVSITGDSGRVSGRLTARAPADGLVLRRGRGAGIRVRVSAEGRPVPGVRVHLQPRPAEEGNTTREAGPQPAAYRSIRSPQEPASVHLEGTVTDAQGQLVAWGFASGQLQVTVSESTFRPVATTATLAEGKLTELKLQLDRGATIEGQVVDDQGAEQQQAEVSFTRLSAEGDSDVATAQVGPDGQFSVGGLEPGTAYALQASALEGVSPAVKVRAPASGVRLVLRARPPLRGRVVDSSGKPIPEFYVDGTRFQSSDGRFEAVAVGVGENPRLLVGADGFTSRMVEGKGGADLGDVVLDRVIALTGRVVGPAGEGVPGAVVSGLTGGRTTSGARGEFTLELGGEEFPMTLRASRGELTGISEYEGKGELVIRIGASTRVEGRVRDLLGRPAPGRVTARGLDGQDSVELTTDFEGRFSAELARGDWSFESGVFHQSARVADSPITIALGGQAGTCALVLGLYTSGFGPLAWLGPEDAGGATADGEVAYGRGSDPGANETYFTRLRCGRYTLYLVRSPETGVERHPVTVDLPVTRLAAPATPAPAAGD